MNREVPTTDEVEELVESNRQDIALIKNQLEDFSKVLEGLKKSITRQEADNNVQRPS